MPQSPHLGGLPFFLMCRYRSFPPGVLITRTLFDRVLYLKATGNVRYSSSPRAEQRLLDFITYGFLRRCSSFVSNYKLFMMK